MRIAGREKLDHFARKHPDTLPFLNYWAAVTEGADWRKPEDARATFRTIDFVAGKAVFNIGGNKCRLIAKIIFEVRLVVILWILTHKEYDKGKWK